MKKFFSLCLTALLLIGCFSFSASAANELPFELKAPANVSVTWLEGGDSPTTMAFAYSLSNEMTSFFQKYDEAAGNGSLETLLKDYGFDEMWMMVQIDWAIDDVNDAVSGWHYTKYWDAGVNGIKYDDDWNIRTSEWDVVDWGLNNWTETVQDVWILRSVPDDERWNGNPETKTPGVKDQLNPDQYSFYDDSVHIDFTKHTAYFRARFVAVTRKDTAEGAKDQYYFSDWSAVCGYGKDAEKTGILKPGDVAAPVIADLHMTDKEFNGNPIVAFTLTVPDELQQQATAVAAAGGMIWIETEARVKGDTEWTALDGDRDIKAGENEWKLLYLVNESHPTIPKDTEIELRCRYNVSQKEQDDFQTDWSKVISFGTDDIALGTQPAATGDPDSVPVDPAHADPDACPICGFCPQPLGICIFIWLLILLVIVVVLIIVLKRKKKK